ncbi:MAG TPA: hypothetical protein VFQ22_04510, partial [Longimicrobiales bacterium]|nr:hypothetical protein [Longimicrobiales bacterium]
MRTAAAWAWAALAGAFASLPAGAAAQRAPAEPAPPVRLVAFVQEPREPELGEVFELTLTLRMGPGTVAFLPDTLLPAEDAASAGHATWTLGLAPADSIDVRATYPVMGFLPGGVELPTLELWARPARAGEAAGPRPASELPEAERGPDGAARRLVLPIGGALIMPPAAMQGGDDALLPEPPADVLGGEWSGWLVAAGGTLALAGALAFVFVADKLRPRRRGTPSPRA